MPYAPTKFLDFVSPQLEADLPGMTIKFCCELWFQDTSENCHQKI
jgi:hypothetical protein